jgi:outer membrane protein assembly factor BamE
MILPRFIIATIALCTFTACSSVPRIVKEYRIDVQQGNVLTQEMVSQLRPGLPGTRSASFSARRC